MFCDTTAQVLRSSRAGSSWLCLKHCSDWVLCAFNSLQETYEAKRNEFLGELQKKEDEMRQMFVMRVKEKEAELKEAEKDVSILYL